MTRTRLTDVACSIARATDLFADAWTALIMRDVLVGITRFDDLAEDLPISRKVLTQRLNRLVEEDVLARERYQDHPPREHYVPTEKGRELFPVLLALMNWGDRWYSQDGPPVRLHHRDCGQDTTAVTTCAHCQEPLTAGNTTQLPGPGGRLGPGTTVIGALLAGRRTR
ncbi:HxlR family transcriptional regulator [Actinoplanes ianthinogenes]|uniref:HxlR family transcriptional regulator n=1 Tax=Actinoplanes ianthinogenes TaxID=122358 RepID=A0ABN6CRU6_9ACTN|nr:helix-turn-helix domain-containing protein [Actinoplanes ianthinogenes]BCJ47922.1 HxlR family transcriptional regulator [Actinoplanes ianthinogenes]GGR05111.1 HxlR family transcriptional regulator [Actinoplanes ianthinogenes]